MQTLRGGFAAALTTVGLAAGLAGAAAPPGRSPGEERVSVTLTRETLGEGLPLLGAAAGRKLAAGPNCRDRRFFLVARNRPLAEVRAQLQRFVPQAPGKASWYRSGSVLVFEEDLASRNARLRLAEQRRRWGEAYRRTGVAAAGDWARPQPGDKAEVAFAREQTARYSGLFAALPEEAKAQALRGRPVFVPYQALSPEGQQRAAAIVRIYSASSGGEEFVGRRDYARTQVALMPMGTPDHPAIDVTVLGLRPRGGAFGGPTLPDIVHPPLYDRKRGWDRDLLLEPYRNRPRRPAELARHPDLQRRVTLEGGEGWTVERVLSELVEQGGAPLIGEYDPCFSQRPPAGSVMPGWQAVVERDQVKNLPLWAALDQACQAFDLTWDYRDDWIWLRSPRTLLAGSGEVDLSPPQPKQKPEPEREQEPR